MFVITQATKKIAALNKRIRVVAGGTAASKTVSILLYLIHRAQSDTKPTLTSVVSESFPHLKRGSIRDFLNILNEHNYFNDNRWNKTDYTYTFETGSQIEFFSADQPGKVRGPRRQRLFINEANNVSLETFEQLEVRTEEFVFIDFNPVAQFWAYDELIGKRNDVDFLKLNYRDNEALNPDVVRSIEARKNKKNWWRVYGEGELGELEERIYSNWVIIDDIPHEARLERHGLDFGYSNDPTTIVDVYYWNGGYIFDECLYQLGMSNKQIADTLSALPKALVIADSAEPKSIAEIRSFGINIVPCEKGRDSVTFGIRTVQAQQIYITKRSTNLVKEYRNYSWVKDTAGNVTPTAQDIWNHCMDALRYAMVSLIPIKRREEYINSLPVPHWVKNRQENEVNDAI